MSPWQMANRRGLPDVPKMHHVVPSASDEFEIGPSVETRGENLRRVPVNILPRYLTARV